MRVLFFSIMSILIAISPGAAADDARLAYIIDINNYEHPSGEIKRGSGADTMANVLSKFGFTVQRYSNIKKWEFEGVLKEIYADSKGAEAAIVYTTGYALGKGDRNVFLPADVVSAGPANLMSRAVEAKDIVNAPRARLLNMVVLDAPENGPEALRLDTGSAFSPFMEAQQPFAPNRIAVYTSSAPTKLYSLLKPMGTPLTFARNFKLFLGRKGRTMSDFLRKVSISVFYDSSSRQFPVVVGKLDKPYVLSHKNEVSDIAAWLKIQTRPKAESFEQFIENFPESIYIPFARKRLKELKKE